MIIRENEIMKLTQKEKITEGNKIFEDLEIYRKKVNDVVMISEMGCAPYELKLILLKKVASFHTKNIRKKVGLVNYLKMLHAINKSIVFKK